MNIDSYFGTVEFGGKTYEAIEPKHQTLGSAGADLATPYPFSLKPGEKILVNLGIIARAPRYKMFLFLPRSGIAFKRLVVIPNSPGLIDSDYSGPEDQLKVGLYNMGNEEVSFKRGDRIAQMVCVDYNPIAFKRHKTPDFGRGGSRGGFGSTGGM